jgi:hypothetical protein
MSDGDWYFCLTHQRAEQGAGCANKDRLGPYSSREDAERALLTAQERNDAWDNDPRWRDD